MNTEKNISQLGLDNSSTRVLSVGTTIISARGTVGKCGIVGIPMTMNQSCYGIRGKDDGTDYYTYYIIRNLVATLQKHAHGSVFSTITRETILSQKIVIPELLTIQKYDVIVETLFQKIKNNLIETHNLSITRDALLPKLMSGELSL